MNNQDNSKNKVYINPNFNRSHTNNGSSNGSLHVNPKFSHLVPSAQCNIQNKNKIYINPNFIKYKSVSSSTNYQLTYNTKEVQPHIHTFTEDSYTTYHQQIADKTTKDFEAPVTQSRYSLVRQNLNNKSPNDPRMEKPKITFKLNKYKTVSLKDVKKKLDKDKSASYPTSVSNFEANFQIPQSSRTKNVFKIVNYSNVSSSKLQKSIIHTEIQKMIYKSNHAVQSRIKRVIKGNLKKNNVPCPLFRKFGKCLRNARGSCEFLHDKKHVSVCRKFIKGICHDKDCLLSHDLTSKKMPTCYFYLQGTCTKTECPYLHVKLNEKAKICSDFVKGYCEKGNTCLQRHVYLPLERHNKTISTLRKKKCSKIKVDHNGTSKLEQNKNIIVQNVDEKTKYINRSKVLQEKCESYSEHRYYEENKSNKDSIETCEIIKPTRCKLGTLPSFIQL
ncbi:zinc finger CCCH domain-containing protein 3 [Spodoptera litura]|uniref:Zinc finger CCCH domain-containing protein 3 n=1 Tax=Spodoptera litura TaxID=69820 RepID=A0A9J7J3J0_SPOLT|nr:zinc finger CCCH domain-containing protein 3 [Spodoptera litura]